MARRATGRPDDHARAELFRTALGDMHRALDRFESDILDSADLDSMNHLVRRINAFLSELQ